MSENKAKDEGYDGVAGAAAGSATGAVLGAILGGAVGGPLGAAVGTGVGTLVGAAGGYAVDYDSHEPAFRVHHESRPTPARHTFEEASPAYRYGWESHNRPEFHDKTYDHIRTELHKGWTGSSDFADYEDYVNHGWKHREESRKLGSFSTAAKG